MPKTKMWPFPLPPGTHVLVTIGERPNEQTYAGTILLPLKYGQRDYVVKLKVGERIATAIRNCLPVDVTDPEAMDRWLDAD